MITQPRGSGSSGTNGKLDEAAAALGGFAGVELDAEAAAQIQVALEACAARARAMDAAFDAGGEAATDAAEADLGESFVPVRETGDPYRGELLPPIAIEEFVPFADGESHWKRAGSEMPAELAAVLEEAERKAGAQAEEGGAG